MRPPLTDSPMPRAVLRPAAVALTTAVLVAALAYPVSAQPATATLGSVGAVDTEPITEVEALAVSEARALLPEHVRDVPVDSAAVARTESEIRQLASTIATNQAIRDQATVDLVRLDDERREHRTAITVQRDRRRSSGQRAEQFRRELAELAVAAYVGGGRVSPVEGIDNQTISDASRHRVLIEAVDTTLRDRLAAAEAEIADAARRVEGSRELLTEVVSTVAATRARRDGAVATLQVAEPRLPQVQEQLRVQFLTARVRGADFNVVAYDAYRNAAARMATEQPSCRLTWSVLAGIARVESRHGTYGGATLRADGSTSRRIIGIALDGSPGIMLIPDTDGGALDGDPVYDRAVGPMQFIPSTWRMVRRDGTGNGRMDPHNMYDAALAAAVYLCRSGPGLDQPAALNRAILTYNRSQPYVNSVLSHRRAYDRLALPG